MVKRQMFGQAGLTLLRKCVLLTARSQPGRFGGGQHASPGYPAHVDKAAAHRAPAGPLAVPARS
jgi:hypothetical protein